MSNQSTNELKGEELNKALLQLHISEYQALTTRISYWLIIQASLLPIVPVYLALIIQVPPNKFDQGFLIWISLVGSQLIAMVWSGTLGEHYAAIKYLECDLRPKIERLFDGQGDLEFWWYERYLDKNRFVPIKYGNSVVPLIEAIAFLGAMYYRWEFALNRALWDVLGCIVSAILVVLSFYSSLQANKIREEATAKCLAR